MKKILLYVLCFLTMLLLCSCMAKEQDNMQISNSKTVTFINGVKDADVWILPQTKENLKTTLWGTPSITKTKTGESYKATVYGASDNGLYILRLIDTDGFFYSADGIKLEEGCTIEIKGSDLELITVEVTDENGVLIDTYEAFSARL